METLGIPFRGNLADVDIGLLRDFVDIVAAGGVTAAEARLGKGKSAISLGLSRLETRLGLRLCERGRGGFRLTAQGQIVYVAALQLFSDIGRFTDTVGSAGSKLEGELTFLADDSFIFEHAGILSRAIMRFRDMFPEMDLNVRMTAPDQIFASVLEGSADLGFTALIQQNDALETIPVCEEHMGIFCARNHPLFSGNDDELSYAELCKYDFVAANVLQQETASQFVSGLSIRANAPTIMSRLLLILSSRYLGIMPVEFARYWVEIGSIREIKIAGGRVDNTCYLINRRSRPLGLGGRMLSRIIVDEIDGPSPL